MQQPLFNLSHPSIQSPFDDGLPQIPTHFTTSNAQTHPLNISNHSDQSKHSSSMNTLNTCTFSHTPNTINTTLTPPDMTNMDHYNTNIPLSTSQNGNRHRFNNVNNHSNNNMYSEAQNIMPTVADTLDPDNVFTHTHHTQHNNDNYDTVQIYPSQPLIGTETIFDENERWHNTDFFSPGHEEIIGAWQTMFPLQEHVLSPPHPLSPPYKRSRPTPLSIPISNDNNRHTQLTAKFNDIGLREPPPVVYHHTDTPIPHAISQSQQQPYNSNSLPPQSQQHYDIMGANKLFPNHSSLQAIRMTESIIPYNPVTTTTASLSSYPTRIAMPILPAAYTNIDANYWQKHNEKPSMYPFPQSKQAYLKPYTPYFEPNSAPLMRNASSTNNGSNRPHSASTKNATKPKGNPFYIPALGAIAIGDDHEMVPINIVASAPALFMMNIDDYDDVLQRVCANGAINDDNNNNNNNPQTVVKRKRGRPRKYKLPEDDDNNMGLQTPSPKKRKLCKRSADRKNLSFVQYLKGDGTGPEMQIEDLSPQKNKRSVSGPNAKGFQRGGLRFNTNANDNVIRIIGGRDKSYKRPPSDHRAYNRIRIWKDKLGRQFYDCICNARKPVQDLNKIKSHVLGHDKIVWVCDICGREFFNNHLQLNAHMKTHKKREIKANEQPIIK